MTIPPKARKFNIRRGTVIGDDHDGPIRTDGGDRPFAVTEDGFGNQVFPGGTTAPVTDGQNAQTNAAAIERALAAIRQEGLTGRQLRMARRMAQKNGINAASDFDAVRQLRLRGIDPFARSPLMNFFAPTPIGGGSGGGSGGGTPPQMALGQMAGNGRNLPATIAQPGLPATMGDRGPNILDEAARMAQIRHVQMEIALRRKRKLALLGMRLAFFVLLPTLIVGWYFFAIATPMYATNSEFVIQKAEAPSSSGGGLGGLLGGSSFATVQESITVQSFLTSREAMLRLDQELGFRTHFSSPAMDPLTRLAPDATDEAMYKTYLRNLTIGYDPTEGLIKMEVLAADPQLSRDYSAALIRYAEERVDEMSQRLREDQMRGAREGYEEAEANMMLARQRVIELQERRGVLSADREVNAVFQQISNFELELQEERLRLSELLSNARPNPARVEVAERNIARLDALITDLRGGLTDANAGDSSLARIQSELMVAETDLVTRQEMLSQSLLQMENARMEANRQSLYLSVGVFPIAPDEAAYPRRFENTVLAFLVFSGIYLLISMTASILREQVSA